MKRRRLLIVALLPVLAIAAVTSAFGGGQSELSELRQSIARYHDLQAAIDAAEDTVRGRTRAGIAAVLGFSSADPRRGRVLFTEARANPVLAERRAAAQELLRQGVLTEGGRLTPESDPIAAAVGAAIFTGAMAELAQQWLTGSLGDDLDAVIDHAIALIL